MKKIISTVLGVLFTFASSAQAENTYFKGKKILIAYYSYSGNTQKIAEAIQHDVGGDLFQIRTEGSYPTEHNEMTAQAKKEIEESYRPQLVTEVNNIEQYDIIFLGSPNWWGTITPQVSSFLATYNLNGKTVIPFITHGGGGVQNTISDMTQQCTGCEVMQNGWVGYGDSKVNLGTSLGGWLEELGWK